jgi:hypothetical protein
MTMTTLTIDDAMKIGSVCDDVIQHDGHGSDDVDVRLLAGATRQLLQAICALRSENDQDP